MRTGDKGKRIYYKGGLKNKTTQKRSLAFLHILKGKTKAKKKKISFETMSWCLKERVHSSNALMSRHGHRGRLKMERNETF